MRVLKFLVQDVHTARTAVPKHIAIPKYFSLYNADKQEAEGKGWTPQGEYYDRLTNNFGKASDCIACGQCERVCPQHLPIINNLKKLPLILENKMFYKT